MSPRHLKELQELSLIFINGKASSKQIQQLSILLTEINQNTNHVSYDAPQGTDSDHKLP